MRYNLLKNEQFKETNTNLQPESIVCCYRRHCCQIFVAFIVQAKQYIIEEENEANERLLVAVFIDLINPDDFSSTYITPNLRYVRSCCLLTTSLLLSVHYCFLSSLNSMKKENKAKKAVVCQKKKIIDVNEIYFLYVRQTPRKTTVATIVIDAMQCCCRCCYL